MKTWLRDHGLALALLALFAAAILGQIASGLIAYNLENAIHRSAGTGLLGYLASGDFLSAVFENWESEFLQMWAFVMLTAYLFQRGSPESKDPDKKTHPQDRDPARDEGKPDAPWAVRAGGWVRSLYSHSLGLALLSLFAISFVLHWFNSARAAAEEAVQHGEHPKGLFARLQEAEFWFESFQNWQSEFLSTAVLIVLAIWLRERGSPESKAVGDPHSKTGG